MRNHTAKTCIGTGSILVLLVCAQATGADTVYKCVKNGKISYSSNPSDKNGQCQQTVIRDDGPNPEDLARLLEQKKLRQEEENKANEAALKEREVRAKEMEAVAAARRARAVEDELLLLRQTPPPPPPVVGFPFYYPYGGGIPGPIHPYPPHDHRPHDRGYEVPRQPMQPNPHNQPAPTIMQLRTR
ncbi:MAG: DUF4124 domain-containing protein [Proteobacteria bacterium]|nr:DUF4124 domain-containing protein [Pseudomonadota bacterium]